MSDEHQHDATQVFDALAPRTWDVAVWDRNGMQHEGRLDPADSVRLIGTILDTLRGDIWLMAGAVHPHSIMHVDGVNWPVPEGVRMLHEAEFTRMQYLAGVVSDLDRSPHGCHRGKSESQDPTGVSQGNDLVPPGSAIGYSRSGRPWVVPHNPSDPDAWEEAAEMAERQANAADEASTESEAPR
jgi:hypothetical protein